MSTEWGGSTRPPSDPDPLEDRPGLRWRVLAILSVYLLLLAAGAAACRVIL